MVEPDFSGTAAEFAERFGSRPDGVWRAPGRVNVIGEHTDYNSGFVLPIAIPHGVTAAASAGPGGIVRAASAQVDAAHVSLTDLTPCGEWHDHVAGVLWAMRAAGFDVDGFTVLLDGDVPLGAGLSSSHALECAVALAINDLYALGLSRDELAELTRRAENEFLGAPTGILDQSASLKCTRGRALFMDTADLSSKQVPFDLADVGLELLVIDTNSPHRHTDGEYATRRAQCEAAAAALGVASLREIDDLDAAVAELSARNEQDGDASGSAAADPTTAASDVLVRRMRHVVTENERVLDLVGRLEAGHDPRTIGPTLTASHASLRDDYDVTVAQLDVAVDAALGAGAYGARMTGGGFGGSVIALIDDADRQPVAAAVRDAFDRFGMSPPDVFDVIAGPGAHRIGCVDTAGTHAARSNANAARKGR